MIEKNDKLQDINQSIDESAMNYYTDPYQLGDTKEQIQIGGEVEATQTKIVEVTTSDTSIEKVNQTYTLTFASSPDGKIWSIGINGMEKTFKVGFYNNDTLAMTTIASEIQTWLGEDYTVAHTTGFTISISKYDGSAITKTSPNLVRKLNLTGFSSQTRITITIDGVSTLLEGSTHSGDAEIALTYLMGQLSTSIYYMSIDSSTDSLIIARKDGAIPVVSKTQYNIYTLSYYYWDTPSSGQYHDYTNTTIDGTTYYFYGSQGRPFNGDKIIRNLYGYTADSTHGISFGSTNSQTASDGFTITSTMDLQVNSITKHASCTATRARLFDNGGSVLATATFSGNTATFSSAYTISKNTTYRVELDNSGSTYTAAYTSGTSFPYTGEFITYTGKSGGGAGDASNITSINTTTIHINTSTYNATTSYSKSSGGTDSVWTSANRALYFSNSIYHTLTLYKSDYSSFTISSVNHYTVPTSFPDDTLHTTITNIGIATDYTFTTYTEIVITKTTTGNNYYIPVGFNPTNIRITAESSAGRSVGTWEGGAKRGIQSCNSSVSGFVADKIFQTSADNYGAIVKITRAGFYMSWTTAVANKLYIECTK